MKDSTTPVADGNFFIVRTDRAGVFFAQLGKREGSECELLNARRIYRWVGANTLSQVAMDGVGSSSQLTITVPSMTVLGVIELIPCSEKSAKSLSALPEWKQ